MDYQGAGRTGWAAGTRRQPPWPSATGPTGRTPVRGFPPAPGFPPARSGYGPVGHGDLGYDPGAPGDLGYDPGAAGDLGYHPGAPGDLGYDPGAAGDLGYHPGAPGDLGYDPGAPGDLGYDPGAPADLGYDPDASGDLGYDPGDRSDGQGYRGDGQDDHGDGHDDRGDGRDDPVLLGPLPSAGGGDPAIPPGRRRGGRARRRVRSRVVLAVAAVAVLAAGGFAGYKFLYEPRVNAPVPPTLRLPTNAPASAGFDQALGKWQHIGTRAEDPQPLTIAGLYPPQFMLNGRSYVRTAASVTKNCPMAVLGPDLQAALQSGHCSQVARASYISGDGTMMGTAGVVNLISSAAAQKAGQATGPDEIIAPLSGQKGPTRKLGNGTGVVQAEIKGHYLILMWAEFTSLKSPSSQAQRQALEQFAANLVTGSANIDLSTRMLHGKP